MKLIITLTNKRLITLVLKLEHKYRHFWTQHRYILEDIIKLNTEDD